MNNDTRLRKHNSSKYQYAECLSSLVAASQFSTSFNSTRVVAQRWPCVSSLMALLSFEKYNRIFNITNCANITMKRIKKEEKN
ncbi:hypothetical protein ALC53_14255 [Atta colombica]|uniref:Uncharacterized protein n=1 Tax=Atta colombica TaxID=520822 RepID=A0A195ATG2_9HYME|nr:hypothetical protein ALC53_14255 [Atta colombica]